MKKIILLFALCFSFTQLNAQDIKNLGQFDANFTIDSGELKGKLGGATINFSGTAGPYGRVYVTLNFSNKLDNEVGLGEFTGYAWSQVEDVITQATLQGSWKFNGKTWTLYSFDSLTDGKIMMWQGDLTMINRTLDLKVQQIE